jgi:hypothetical protein
LLGLPVYRQVHRHVVVAVADLQVVVREVKVEAAALAAASRKSPRENLSKSFVTIRTGFHDKDHL